MTDEQYFDEQIRKHGAISKGVGMSEQSHRKRFEAIFKVCEFDYREYVSVLDVGCGYGAFLDFLIEKGVQVKDYVGIDVSSEMITHAPVWARACFVQKDIFHFSTKDQWDFVIANGILNLPIIDNALTMNNIYMERLLRKSFLLCKIAAVVTMTYDQGQKKDPATFYYDRHILSCIPKNPKKIVHDWSYLPNDFMVYMER